jgi:hypothetical protein
MGDWTTDGLNVRLLRGKKMKDYEGLFNEFSAALQFPWYFGENGNAFDECLADLSWMPPRLGYVLVISHGEECLELTKDSGLTWLVGSLERAATDWSISVDEGQPWDREPVPFHIVLQEDPTSPSRGAPSLMWEKSGARVSRYDEASEG